MAVEVMQEAEVPERDSVTFVGEQFAIADKVGLMPLLKFAKIAHSGLDSSDAEGMAAMYDMLQQCIADDEWLRFEDHATKTRAGDEELLQVVKDAISLLTMRPTSRPSASLGGPQPGTPNSEDDSSSLEVVRRLKSQGRPDLAMAVYRQQAG